MTKKLGIIPARYASSRFPGKPLALLRNKTMIEHVYTRVSAALDKLVVATDDKRIFDAVRSFGGLVVMTSGQHRSGTERCREALDIFENTHNFHPEIIINIQGDEPMIEADQIRELLACFEAKDTGIATLIQRISGAEDPGNRNIVKVVVDKHMKALYFSRSVIPFPQKGMYDKDQIFFKHIGMYGYRATVLKEISQLAQTDLERSESLEQLRWMEHGYSIQTRITGFKNIGVDTPEDLDQVKRIMG